MAHVTDHAARRTKERLGISKRISEKNADKALQMGIRHSETSGSLHRYITALYWKNQTANNVRIYCENVYTFHDITSLPSGRTWDAYQGIQKNWYRPFTNSGLIKDADVPEDDNAFSCVFATSGGCYYDPGQREYQYAFPWWPAFKRTWELRILGVTLQHRK